MRTLGLALITFGIGVATAALLGPLVSDVIAYHVIDDVLNQVMGGDAIGLVLVAPTAIAAGVLMIRGHRAGPVVALAPAGYGIYTYTQLALGGEFAVQPGNSERFFLLFLFLFILGAWVFIGASRFVDDTVLPEPSGRVRTTAVTVLFLVAGFLAFGLHAPGLIDVLGGEPFDVDYTQSPTVFWIVKLMDLGIVVPAAIAAAIGLLRGASWAGKVMYAVIGWGALLGSAVAGMAVVMQVNDDPAASTTNTIVFVVFALSFLGLAAWIYRPLFVIDGGTPTGADRIRT